jgi:hypothetical protein
MNHTTRLPARLLRSAATMATLLLTSIAMASPVEMPTPSGVQSFDSTSFAVNILAGPTGQFACFTGSVLSACTVATLESAVLGSDLINGLTLGLSGEITLSFATAGTGLHIWEAGDIGSSGDTEISFLSVHTANGWSVEKDYGPGHILHVLNDIQPSGYPTNFSSFSALDFGLALGETFDALRIRACCSNDAHLDLLAVVAIPSAVPEPGTAALTLLGLLGIGLTSIRKLKQPASYA